MQKRFAILTAVVLLSLGGLLLSFLGSESLRGRLHGVLMAELARTQAPPAGATVDVIYLLGGPTQSQRYKFMKAAHLYREGVSDTIWILSKTGITRYSFELKRNFTYDEWALDRLSYHGIPGSSVVPVTIEEGFFGTLSEARAMPDLLDKSGAESLLVVAAPYHTARVKTSFGHFIDTPATPFYIVSSEEPGPLSVLVKEYLKLRIYQLLLWLE